MEIDEKMDRRKSRRQDRLAVGAISLFLVVLFLFTSFSGPLAYGRDNRRPLTILVLGDSLAEGLYYGIYWAVRRRHDVRVVKDTEVGAGLAYLDLDAWQKKLALLIKEHQPDVAVVMVGGNDRIPILHNGQRRYAFCSEDWTRLYRQRVAAYIQALLVHDLSVFWVGLPAMRTRGYDLDMQNLNGIYRSAANKAGIRYIPTRENTVDQNGDYSAYGFDITGKRGRIRSGDGKHFTACGYELLAWIVLKSMKMEVPAIKVAEFDWPSKRSGR